RPAPSSPFPYTTLFRSRRSGAAPRTPRAPATTVAGARVAVDRASARSTGSGLGGVAGRRDELNVQVQLDLLGDQHAAALDGNVPDRKSTRLNSSHVKIS